MNANEELELNGDSYLVIILTLHKIRLIYSCHLKPGGKLYVIGLNPIIDKVDGYVNIIYRINNLRDACISLAGKCIP